MRKNILIFGHSYATQFIDINNQYTKLFDPEKYCVTIAYLTGEPDDAIKQKHLAKQIIFLNADKKSIRGLKINSIKQLANLCRKHHFDIVICHRYKPIYIMLWAALFCKIPAIFFVMHDLKTLNAISRQLLIALLAKNKKNMIFAGVSNAVRDDMRNDISFIPTERVITLYNMIDVAATESQLFTRTAARKALHLAEDDFVFGCVARLVPVKNHHNTIHAFSQIKSHCPKAKLIFLGDGELENSLKKQVCDLGLENNVIFTGYMPNASRYMKAFDAFILNSTREAFGRVLLEAMIAKLPIVAARTDGIPEVLGNTGYIIDPTNPIELAQHMQSLYQKSPAELYQLGSLGYQRAIDDFSLSCFHTIFWQLPIHHNKEKK